MDPKYFSLDPSLYGVPSRNELVDYRIWDGHYHGLFRPENPFINHKKMMFYVERMGIERIISLDAGGTMENPLETTPYNDAIWDLLEKDQAIISGMTPIDPGYPDESCEKIVKWVRNGPCIGIKYYGNNKLGITCSHANNDKIIKLAGELGAVIYIHTWTKIGGNPRQPGEGNNAGESSPMDVAILAERFPDIPLLCGHSGGDWELAIPVIRPYENVYLQFDGSDPHSGAIDKAVNELGAERITWGGHGPSRSYATELSKVLGASISKSDKMKILGGNLRNLAENIFNSKGLSMQPQ